MGQVRYSTEDGQYIDFDVDGDKPSQTEQQRINDHLSQYNALTRPRAAEAPQKEALGPWGAGWKNVGADLNTLGGGIAQAFGATETAQRFQGEADRINRDVSERYKPIDLYDIGKTGGVGQFASDVGQFAYEKGVESLPYVIPGILTGGAANLAGLGLGASRVAAANLGRAGFAAASYPFHLAGNVNAAAEDTGKSPLELDWTKAALTAIPQTALDMVTPEFLGIFGKLPKWIASGTPAQRKIAQQTLGTWMGSVSKEALEAMVLEAGTETVQQALEIFQANPEKFMSLDADVRKQLITAGVAGGFVGGVMSPLGGGRGALERAADEREKKKEEVRQLKEQIEVAKMTGNDEESKKLAAAYSQALADEAAASQAGAMSAGLGTAYEEPQSGDLFRPEVLTSESGITAGYRVADARGKTAASFSTYDEARADARQRNDATLPTMQAMENTPIVPLRTLTPATREALVKKRFELGQQNLEAHTSLSEITSSLGQTVADAERTNLASMDRAKLKAGMFGVPQPEPAVAPAPAGPVPVNPATGTPKPTEPALHFVGFNPKDEMRLQRAKQVFGEPDFVHRKWDQRAARGGEFAEGDTRVFAEGTETDAPSPYSYDDSADLSKRKRKAGQTPPEAPAQAQAAGPGAGTATPGVPPAPATGPKYSVDPVDVTNATDTKGPFEVFKDGEKVGVFPTLKVAQKRQAGLQEKSGTARVVVRPKNRGYAVNEYQGDSNGDRMTSTVKTFRDKAEAQKYADDLNRADTERLAKRASNQEVIAKYENLLKTRQAAVQKMMARLSALASPPGLKIVLRDTLEAPDQTDPSKLVKDPTIEGYYDPGARVLALSLDIYSPNMTEAELTERLIGVVDHEFTHVHQHAGSFTKTEWKAMSKYLKAKQAYDPDGTKIEGETWYDRAKAIYQRKDSDTDAVYEYRLLREAMAEAMRSWAKNKSTVTGQTAGIFRRIVEIVKTLGGFLKSEPRAEQIFREIDGARRKVNLGRSSTAGIDAVREMGFSGTNVAPPAGPDPSRRGAPPLPKADSYGGILVNDKGQVLLREPSNHYGGYVWTFAKGRPDEANEDPTEVALREVLQETGYEAEVTGTIDEVFGGTTSSTSYHVMRPVGEQGKPDFETANTKWVSLDEAEKLIGKTTTPVGRARDLKTIKALRGYMARKSEGSDLSRRGPNTPEFKRWFGSSKIVDPNGEPLVVYHGTASDIREFKADTPSGRGSLNYGAGIYFAARPKDAAEYAYARTQDTNDNGENVLPVYLSIQNPFVVEENLGGLKISREQYDILFKKSPEFRRVVADFESRLKTGKAKEEERLQLERLPGFPKVFRNVDGAGDFVRTHLKMLGFDGIDITSRKDRPQYVAFDSNQIKSASGNIGSYSPDTDRIDFSKRGLKLYMTDKTEAPSGDTRYSFTASNNDETVGSIDGSVLKGDPDTLVIESVQSYDGKLKKALSREELENIAEAASAQSINVRWVRASDKLQKNSQPVSVPAQDRIDFSRRNFTLKIEKRGSSVFGETFTIVASTPERKVTTLTGTITEENPDEFFVDYINNQTAFDELSKSEVLNLLEQFAKIMPGVKQLRGTRTTGGKRRNGQALLQRYREINDDLELLQHDFSRSLTPESRGELSKRIKAFLEAKYSADLDPDYKTAKEDAAESASYYTAKLTESHFSWDHLSPEVAGLSLPVETYQKFQALLAKREELSEAIDDIDYDQVIPIPKRFQLPDGSPDFSRRGLTVVKTVDKPLKSGVRDIALEVQIDGERISRIEGGILDGTPHVFHVDWAEGVNRKFTVREGLNLLRQIAGVLPGVKKLKGFRISGAKINNPKRALIDLVGRYIAKEWAKGNKSTNAIKASKEFKAYVAQIKADLAKVSEATDVVIEIPERFQKDFSRRGMIDTSTIKRTGDKPGGSAEGFLGEMIDGTKVLVKKYKTDGQAVQEVLASQLYKLAGVDAADMSLAFDEETGGIAVVSRWITAKPVNPASKEDIEGIRKGFAVDAWVANWDTVGLSFDNIVKAGGKYLRIDPGGSLDYRAQGGKKGKMFGSEVIELDGLRNPAINPEASRIYGGMTQTEIGKTINALRDIDDRVVRQTILDTMADTPEEAEAMADKMEARRNWLLAWQAQRAPETIESRDYAKRKSYMKDGVKVPENVKDPNEFVNWWKGAWREGDYREDGALPSDKSLDANLAGKSSVISYENGDPMWVLHGTSFANDDGTIPTRFPRYGSHVWAASFFTPSPAFANGFVRNGKAPRLIKAYLSAQNMFNIKDPKHLELALNWLEENQYDWSAHNEQVKKLQHAHFMAVEYEKLGQKMSKISKEWMRYTKEMGTWHAATPPGLSERAFLLLAETADKHVEELQRKYKSSDPDIRFISDLDNWFPIEQIPEFRRMLRTNGFDSFTTLENGVQNFAVVHPNQIKSTVNPFETGEATRIDHARRGVWQPQYKSLDATKMPKYVKASSAVSNFMIPDTITNPEAFAAWLMGDWRTRMEEKHGIAKVYGMSKAVYKDGTPRAFYHGSGALGAFVQFRPRGGDKKSSYYGHFFSPSPTFAMGFSGGMSKKGAGTLRAYLSVQLPFDVTDTEHLATAEAYFNSLIDEKKMSPYERDNKMSELRIARDSANTWNKVDKILSKIDEDWMFDVKELTGYSNMDFPALALPADRGFKAPQNAAIMQEFKDLNTGSIGWLSNWNAIENEHIEGLMKYGGFDGFYTIEGGVRNIAVISPRQVKSIFNPFEGQYPQKEKDFSKRGIPTGVATRPLSATDIANVNDRLRYTKVRDMFKRALMGGTILGRRVGFSEKNAEGIVNWWIDNFQDHAMSLGEIVDEVRKNKGSIPDTFDAYLQQQLWSSRATTHIERMNDGLYQPMIRAIKSLKFSEKDFTEFKAKFPRLAMVVEEAQEKRAGYLGALLYAYHAPERNAVIGNINNGMVNGSGLSNAEANAAIKWFESHPEWNKLSQARNIARRIVDETNNIRVQYGLTPDYRNMQFSEAFQKAGLPNGYKHYVPLRGMIDEDSLPNDIDLERLRTGVGFKIKGKEDISALGRETMADNIVEHIVLQNEVSIARAHKNVVGNSFYNLVKANPGTLGKVARIVTDAPTKRYLGEDGTVKFMVEPGFLSNEKYFVTKINGENMIVEIMSPRLAKTLNGSTGYGDENIQKVINFIGGFTRLMSRLATGLNPEFWMRNVPRDMLTAAINVNQYEIPNISQRLAASWKSSFSTVRRNNRFNSKYLKTGEEQVATANGPDDILYQEFLEDGGFTGYLGLSDLETRMAEMHTQIAKGEGGKIAKGVDLIKRVAGFVEGYNNVFENATRFAVYKVMRDHGLSRDRSAQAAKTVTTNFNAGGWYKNMINPFYMFYNASLQGTMGILTAGVRSGKVRKIMGSIIVMGILQDIIASMASDEDETGALAYDSIKDHVHEHFMVFPDFLGVTDDKYLKLPMPYGYNAIFNFGRVMAKYARNVASGGDFGMAEAVDSALGTVIDATNPLGAAGSFLNFAAPTILDPIVDLTTNEDFAKRTIVKRPMGLGVDMPSSQLYMSSTSPTFVGIADFLNDVSGGTDVIPGAMDFSPDAMQYLYDYFLSGAGAFVRRTVDLGTGALPAALMGDFDALDVGEIPMVRAVVGEVSDRDTTSKFMEVRDSILLIGKELQDASIKQDINRIKNVRENYTNELKAYPAIKAANSQRNAIVKRMAAVRANEKLPAEAKAQLLKDLKEAEIAAQVRGLRAYNTFVQGMTLEEAQP